MEGSMYPTQGFLASQATIQSVSLAGGERPSFDSTSRFYENPKNGSNVKLDKKLKLELPTNIPKDMLEKINKEVLCLVASNEDEDFYCSLCHSRLTGVWQLERHTMAVEHLRRIVSLSRDRSGGKYCEICHCMCSCDDIFDSHLSGKKHLKNLESYRIGKYLRVTPLGDSLQELLRKDVVSEGSGITLGMSKFMIELFSLKGPFIGLQHAIETGTANDPNPGYTCTLCNVIVDGFNFQLHFTSSTHRINVLKSDYPDKYDKALKIVDTVSTKGDFNVHLEEIAAEIEGNEGKKIELIQRRILRSNVVRLGRPHVKQKGSKKDQGGLPQRKNSSSENYEHSSHSYNWQSNSGSRRGEVDFQRKPYQRNSDNWKNEKPHRSRSPRRQDRRHSSRWDTEEDSRQQRSYTRERVQSTSSGHGYKEEHCGNYSSSFNAPIQPQLPTAFPHPSYAGYTAQPNFTSTQFSSPVPLSPAQYPTVQNAWSSNVAGQFQYAQTSVQQPPQQLLQQQALSTEQPSDAVKDATALLNILTKPSIASDQDAETAYKITSALTQALLAYSKTSSKKSEHARPPQQSFLLGFQGNSSR